MMIMMTAAKPLKISQNLAKTLQLVPLYLYMPGCRMRTYTMHLSLPGCCTCARVPQNDIELVAQICQGLQNLCPDPSN